MEQVKVLPFRVNTSIINMLEHYWTDFPLTNKVINYRFERLVKDKAGYGFYNEVNIVIPFVLIKVTEFNENKFSRTRRLIEQ
jgi:hypothetical protein